MTDETELARTRRQFAEVQRLAHLGSWEWDVRADEVTWSDELYRLYGLAPGEFEATYEAFLERVHPDDRDMVDGTVKEAYGSAGSYSFEHRIVRPDGTVRWLHGRGRTVTDATGAVVRLHGVGIDITERKSLERFHGELLANTAHALRTPITAVVAAARVLDEAGDQRPPEVLDVLRRNGARLHQLTSTLLDLAALSSGETTVALAPVPVADAVADAVAAVEGADAERVDVPGDVRALAGPAELRRVLEELLTNAVQHGDGAPEVVARVDGGEVVLTVRDRGPGVAPEQRELLFAPFASTAGGAGRGLGLALAARLVAAFGGTIEHVPGEPGALFLVRLEVA